jgi:HAE1 family hydrophobic/amphiphilic exporter-1
MVPLGEVGDDGVTKNAILIVDFTNTLRREHGYGRKAALVEAGKLRLRPIMMTTLVLIFALLPLLFRTGPGSELRAPMAAVVVGGNITSTLLSLILVPVVYNALNVLAEFAGRVTRAVAGSPDASGEPSPETSPRPQVAVAAGWRARPGRSRQSGCRWRLSAILCQLCQIRRICRYAKSASTGC